MARFVVASSIILYLVACGNSTDTSTIDSDDERFTPPPSLRRKCHRPELLDRYGAAPATKKQSKVAYSMAVLSALSYCLPTDAKSFRVVKRRHVSILFRLLCEARRFLQRFWQRLVRRRSPSIAKNCPATIIKNASAKFELKYWFKDWKEPTIIPGVRYHDTDLVIASHRDAVIFIFSGSASPTDHATNIQTFEKASHASIFPGNGSLHRGFLNAYSRVNHGLLYSFANDTNWGKSDIWQALGLPETCLFGRPVARGRYELIKGGNHSLHSGMNFMVKQKRQGGCRVKHVRLRSLLLLKVRDTLLRGKHVHITGHSLGGAVATLLATDILVNELQVPVRKLHLWTFGAPEIANRLFWHHFENNTRVEKFFTKNSRRYVTFSDRCLPDMISSIVPGGSHGPSKAIYLPTSRGTSVLAAHFMPHYLLGLSRETQWSSDLPTHTRENCLGEDNRYKQHG